ncbi:MAG: LCP family protein [Thermanaerothrix sp.]|nr:LCP family protein [Thermanaerothrix sp.]
MSQLRTRTFTRRFHLDRLTLIVLIVFIILAVTTGWAAFSLARNIFRSWSMTNLGGVPVGPNTANASGTAAANVPLHQPLQENGPAPEPWDGKSRVTVLVMGLDYRDWEAGETPRTDTMMLLTLDPLTRTAGILSIPRDMWVNIPGFDYGKINTAYFLGETYKLPGGGPGLAVETVRQFLGVPINYYAQIDFYAFERFIDEIGGVKLRIQEPITLYPTGNRPKVHLEPGVYSVGGDLALAYARNRYTEGGDFDRARRQQEVILAIRDRILQYDQIPKLVAKAPILYNELSAGIRTNMTLQEAIQLAWLAVQIPAENIKRGVIGPDAVEMATSPDGLDILIPIPDKIRLVRDEVFSTNGAVGPAAVAEDPKVLMQAENARVVVQNGTSVVGLAGRTAEFLRNEGVNVVQETNADNLYSQTTIFLYSPKPYTLNYLISVMQLQNPRIYNRYDPNAEVDIAIALGNDWAQSNVMP